MKDNVSSIRDPVVCSPAVPGPFDSRILELGSPVLIEQGMRASRQAVYSAPLGQNVTGLSCFVAGSVFFVSCSEWKMRFAVYVVFLSQPYIGEDDACSDCNWGIREQPDHVFQTLVTT